MYLYIMKCIANTGNIFLVKVEQRASASNVHVHQAAIKFACMEAAAVRC